MDSKRIKSSGWLPIGVLLIGLTLTIAIATILRVGSTQRHDERQRAELADVSAAIEFRMASYVRALSGTRALFAASDEVTTDDFATYVETLRVLEELPGIQAMGWNRLVQAEDVASYEQAIRDRDRALPDFAVRPIQGNAELLVVEYIEPAEGNEAAFGFDILSEERRAEAIRLARATDRAVATAPISLIQGDASLPGILVVLPTRSNGIVDGAVVAVFRTGDLLTATALDVGRSFVVQDIGAIDSPPSDPTTLSDDDSMVDDALQQEIAIHGRRWLVSLTTSSEGVPSLLGLVIGAVSGVGLAVALAWLVRSTQRAAQIADRKAASLNAELTIANEELAIVGSRLERGIRSADILVWESNLTTGSTWSSADLESPESGIEDDFFGRVHPSDRDDILAASDPAPGDTRAHEFRLADKDGKYRWVLSRSHGVLRSEDHVVIGAHIDITDQHEHLELVERLNEDLTERNQALSDFTHVASHDLRSPLRAVSSLVTFLREDLPEEVGEQAEHHLERIDGRVARMSQLIDDLLVYAQAHSRETRVEHFVVADVVHEILETLDVPDRIRTLVDCDLPTVALAKTPFVMCVRNLVDNALKHNDNPDGLVVVTAHFDEAYLELAVTDNGPGIDATYVTKIFEPFRRLRVDEPTPGSGIGLSVIERATGAHGGSIDVHSVLGEGSTFTIRWPLSRSEQLSETATVSP